MTTLRRILLLCAALLAAVALVGCLQTQESVEAPEPEGPNQTQAMAAFEAMHPGFSAREAEAAEAQWIITAQSDDNPRFWIRSWVAPVPDGDVTAAIDGTEWSTESSLQEVTENAKLMPGDMRTQFMQAVVDDVGIIDADNPGGFVTSVSVVSNTDMSVGFSSDTGDLNLLDYKLDLASGDWVPAR
ncbi:MAG: hypothetical protein JXE06_02935 [Coriobacteriia bacterium]|nr:hypothetical protein [Coriobacteriia bacterium]MBN2822398.1 hypothetical protein [Coriobacteriia bacterium]